jgi:hypothetical protein
MVSAIRGRPAAGRHRRCANRIGRPPEALLLSANAGPDRARAARTARALARRFTS